VDIVKILQTALTEADNQRDRNVQVDIGASSIGGCRTAAWHIMNQTPKTNHNTERLAALLGTAIHSVIAEALVAHDVFGDDFMIEQELSTPELRGHCDFYSRSEKLVVDWKTTSLKNITRFPSAQQKMQVHLYGYLLQENGYPVDEVALVAIPRDGKMSDIRMWRDKYSEYQAKKGLEWLKEIKQMETPPPAERSAAYYCRDYCQFYDRTGETGCQGK
jgi:hypothetical protein